MEQTNKMVWSDPGFGFQNPCDALLCVCVWVVTEVVPVCVFLYYGLIVLFIDWFCLSIYLFICVCVIILPIESNQILFA